jgi:hypothetical protein
MRYIELQKASSHKHQEAGSGLDTIARSLAFPNALTNLGSRLQVAVDGFSHNRLMHGVESRYGCAVSEAEREEAGREWLGVDFH